MRKTCNIGQMNFLFQFDVAIMMVSMHSKNENAILEHSRGAMLTERQMPLTDYCLAFAVRIY